MHFGSWFYKDVPASRKRIENLSKSLKLVAAYDGMEIKI
jgi:hypothetical protein